MYLSLGSNSGPREVMLKEARQKLTERVGVLIRKSKIYETEPWGFHAKQTFLNQVVLLETTLPPYVVLDKILEIESELGRIRDHTHRYRSRTIDIDILYYDDLVIKELDLCIPHPELENRRFILHPLTEIAPRFIHPVLKKSNQELMARCPDTLQVTPST